MTESARARSAPPSARVPPESGRCIACHDRAVETFLDLGETSLANRFLAEEELSDPEPRFPLRVGFCHGCGHVQLREGVAPDELFTDYLYVSSASETLKQHFEELSALLCDRRRLGPDDLVVDIGCNDGALLSCFRARGVRTLGVDPALNLAELAGGTGIERFTGFFGAASAREIRERRGRAALITATNTFPHIPQLDEFIEGLETLLAPGGAFVLEAHYLVDLIDQLAFDTIYHEHVSYWALRPMVSLFARHGFHVVHAERLPLHHGQLRATIQRAGEGVVDESVWSLLEYECERRFDEVDIYREFGARVRSLGTELRTALEALKRDGYKLAGYGAPAKGSTLLEYAGLGPDTVSFIADRSALKQGRFTPGSRIPIFPPDRLLEERPDYVLLLAWNFADEIVAQQQEYLAGGGRFIVPVPEVRVL